MSLFSAIAHDGVSPTRGLSRKTIGIVVAGLALGVALGFAIVNNPTAAESSAAVVAPSTGLAQDEFIRLNTTDLENLVSASSSAVTESQAAVTPFIQMNTTDLDNLAAAAVAVDPFIDLNVNSYEGLIPPAAAESQTVVDSNFLNWNIASLEYPTARYTEQSSGPR